MMHLPEYREYAIDYTGELSDQYDIEEMALMLREACNGESPDDMAPDDFKDILVACEL